MNKCVILLIGLMACSSAPKAYPPTTIYHGGCWYQEHKLVGSVQYSGPVIDIYKDIWVADCREDYLERLQRANCTLLAVNPKTVIASGCTEFIGLIQ